MDHPKFYLMQDSTGTTNLKQILQKVKRKKPKEKKRPFRLVASGLSIREMDFKHRKRDRIDRQGAVNFTDLEVADFNCGFTMCRSSTTACIWISIRCGCGKRAAW